MAIFKHAPFLLVRVQLNSISSKQWHAWRSAWTCPASCWSTAEGKNAASQLCTVLLQAKTSANEASSCHLLGYVVLPEHGCGIDNRQYLLCADRGTTLHKTGLATKPRKNPALTNCRDIVCFAAYRNCPTAHSRCVPDNCSIRAIATYNGKRPHGFPSSE
nr:hypothetical protein CFP56_34755 [Quercus suber]